MAKLALHVGHKREPGRITGCGLHVSMMTLNAVERPLPLSIYSSAHLHPRVGTNHTIAYIGRGGDHLVDIGSVPYTEV